MSEHPDIDGQQMALEDALARIVDDPYGTFISCVPGKLAYFHDEEIEHRFIMERA